MIKRMMMFLMVLAVFTTIAPQVEAGGRGRSHGRRYERSSRRPFVSVRIVGPGYYGGRYCPMGYPYYGVCEDYRYGYRRPVRLPRIHWEERESQASYREREIQEVERESEKLFRNDFANVTVQVYVGSSPRPFSLKPGERKIKEVPADAPVWAEVELKDAQGHKVLSQLQLGTGISSLPNEAGWVFHNPRQARRN